MLITRREALVGSIAVGFLSRQKAKAAGLLLGYPQRLPNAFCWYEGTSTALNPHLVPMGLDSGGVDMSPDTPTLISSYGKTYTVNAGHYQSLAITLLTFPAGRRSIRQNWPNDWLWGNADDRCLDAGGTIIGSATPTTNGGIYRDATNGWSNVFLSNFIAGAFAWGAASAAWLQSFGVSTNEPLYMVNDAESKIDSGSGLKVNGTYRAILHADPRWATSNYNNNGIASAQSQLDTIINTATGGSPSTFSFASWDAGDVPHQNAWNAFMWQRQAIGLDAVIAGMRTVFPNTIGSNYEHHGRSGVIVNASGTNGGLTDLNGNLYYQPQICGNISSEYSYGWLNQEGIKFLNTLARSYWGNFVESDPDAGYGNNPFMALKWELARGIADATSGVSDRRYVPWLGWMGFDDSDFALGGYGDAGTTDKCPYWEANFALQSLLAYGQVLYWNSRTYFTSGPHPVSVDQANKEFIFSGPPVTTIALRVRPGLCSSIKITGSTGNDRVYTVNYIVYNSGADQTHIRVNEAIASPIADGRIDQLPTAANDALANTVLADVRSYLSGLPVTPISINALPLEIDPATGAERVPTGNAINWVAVQDGSAVIYGVAIGRSLTNKALFTAQTVKVWLAGVNIDSFVIPADKAYRFYRHTSRSLVFTWDQTEHGANPANLLVSVDPTDTGNWTQAFGGGGAIALSSTHLSPINGGQTYRFFRATAIESFPVSIGRLYTIGCYVWVGDSMTLSSRAIAVLRGSDGSVLGNMSMDVSTVQLGGSNTWQLYYLTFATPEGETTMRLRLGNTSYDSWYCHPQVVQGMLPGPIA